MTLFRIRRSFVGFLVLFGLIWPVSAGITHCATNRVVSANSTCAASLPDLTSEVESSDGGIPTQDPVPGTILSLGTNLITFSVTDTNGATDSCTAALTVVDDLPPVFVVCATNRSLAAAANCLLTLPDLTGELTVTDSCSGVTLSQDPQPGTTLALGSHLVTFTATDAATNTSTCTLTLLVIDNSAPVISFGPTNTTLSAVTNCAAIVPDLTTQIVASDCSPFTITQNPLAGTLIPPGTNEVVLMVTDSNGLSAAWSVILTVVDDIPPVFVVCATNRSLAAGANCLLTLPDLTGELTVTDSCSAVILSQDPPAGTALALGSHLVTFTATDAATNSSTCTLTLSVIDNSAPIISSGPTNMTLTAGTNCAVVAPDLTGQVVASDCSSFTVIQNPMAGSLLSLGTNTIVLTATDTNGFTSSVSTRITVVLATSANTNITISEFMAKNNSTLADEDGTFSDWIEIHNSGTCPLNLNNWSLTDKASQLTEWRFPNTNIAAGQFLVVWASGKDRRTPGAPLHTNFKCDDAGEYLALVQPDGVTIATQFSPAFLPQVADISYGLASDTLTYTYLAQPTPGGPNSVSTNLNTGGCATNIVISEFMAKNTTTLTDEDGEFSDWIEIHNGSACPLNLNNWCLTDDASQLSKWRFPSTNLASGQFLVVFASNKNRRVPGAPLHTNFRLADEGEYLALVRPDGISIASQFSPTYPPQVADVSYGLPTNSTTYSYLAFPTPGTTNSAGTNFFVEALQFHPPRGWYTNFVSISIRSPTPAVTIYYTTNGTIPSPTNGFIYSNRLVFSNSTVVRAAGYLAGFVPAIDAHTYIFPYTVMFQTAPGYPTTWGTNFLGELVPAVYRFNSNVVSNPQWSNQVPGTLFSLPTVSLALNPDDMFGPTNGIYANTFGAGDQDERACSAEYFRPDSPEQFQIHCGLRVQGELSRDPTETPKHHLRILFKSKYGPTKLDFPLYPNSPVSTFDSLPLHAIFNDNWPFIRELAQFERDIWASDTQREMGGFGTHGKFVHLYINGLYWGIYNFAERPDASYGAHYLGGDKSDYDAFSSDDLKDGTTNARNAMLELAAAGITNEVAYSNMNYYLDVPHFIDYMLINFYGNNQDWPGHNFWLTGDGGHGTPFHFFSYDAEQVILFSPNQDMTGINFGTPGIIYDALRKWPPFCQLFGDHANKLLLNGGALTPERCVARWMNRAQEIDFSVISESARWGFNNYPYLSGTFYTHDNWFTEQTNLLANWFPVRTGILLQQLRNRGLFPALDAPVFRPYGGIIVGTLPVTMSAPVGAIYYTLNGIDPQMPDGSISPDALLYTSTLNLTNTVQLRARVFETNAWSALTEASYQRAEDTIIKIRDVTHRPNGYVDLQFTAWTGVNYTLQTSTNLHDWNNLATLVSVPDGNFEYLDRSATNYPTRFYRLVWP